MRFQKKKWMKKCPKLPVCRCNHRVRPCVPICTAGWNKQPSALFRTVSGEFPRARNGRLSGRTAGSKSIAGERRTSKFDVRQIHQPAVRAERRSEVASKQRIPGLSDIKILGQHRTIAEASAVESPIRQVTIGFPAHFFARAHNFKPPGRACQPEADSPMRT